MASLLYWVLAALVAAYLVLDGFDLGIGTLLWFSGTSDERTTFLRAIGPIWNGNEVWLIGSVGLLLAAFPAAYGVVLSGLYVPAIVLLCSLIIRDISIELRGRANTASTRRLWEALFAFGSAVTAALIGAGAAVVMHGLPVDASGVLRPSSASSTAVFGVFGGIFALAATTLHGSAWLRVKVSGASAAKSRKSLIVSYAVTVASGVAILAAAVRWVPALLPWNTGRLAEWVFAACTVGAIVAVLPAARSDGRRTSFVATSVLLVGTVGWVASALYPSLVPSTLGASFDLTIHNAASGTAGLKTLVVLAAIGVPLVAAMNVLLYRVFRGQDTGSGTDEGY